MANSELLKLTISELAPKIKSKEVSPVEVIDAALEQADRLQPKLNSFITLLGDQARSQAKEREDDLVKGNYRGPLHGIPIGIKDNIATAGTRTTVGSKVLTDNVTEEDAHVVSLCQQAGAIVLGKENLEEFAAGVTSNNPHYGPVHNPWNLDHVPGGSSGGSGANVSACVTFASLGTDLGGSVRLPGTFCGVVGLKQTFGRVSQRGLLVTSYNGDHIGPLTRSVTDSVLMLQAMAGHDPLDPSTVPVPVPDFSANLTGGLRGLKVGIPTNFYFEDVDPEVEEMVRKAIAVLEELGAEPREVAIPSLRYAGALRIPGMADGFVTHEPLIKASRQAYGPDTVYRHLSGQFVLARDYSKAMKVQRIIKEEHARVLQDVDFLATPTAPVPPPSIGQTYISMGDVQHRVRGPGQSLVSKNTQPGNATGLPGITVPCGFTNGGLPIGLHLMGRPFEEGLIFRAAYAYEAVSPAKGKRPPVLDGA